VEGDILLLGIVIFCSYASWMVMLEKVAVYRTGQKNGRIFQ
jgi:hypothetical protein